MEHCRRGRGLLVVLVLSAVLLNMMKGVHGISRPERDRTNVGSFNVNGPNITGSSGTLPGSGSDSSGFGSDSSGSGSGTGGMHS